MIRGDNTQNSHGAGCSPDAAAHRGKLSEFSGHFVKDPKGLCLSSQKKTTSRIDTAIVQSLQTQPERIKHLPNNSTAP